MHFPPIEVSILFFTCTVAHPCRKEAGDYWKCRGIAIFNCNDWTHEHLKGPIPLFLKSEQKTSTSFREFGQAELTSNQIRMLYKWKMLSKSSVKSNNRRNSCNISLVSKKSQSGDAPFLPRALLQSSYNITHLQSNAKEKYNTPFPPKSLKNHFSRQSANMEHK